MDPKKVAKAAQPASLGKYLSKKAPPGQQHGGHGSSTRFAEYRGHKIMLETTYLVTIDDKVVHIPLMVDDRGQVHCHSLPNYQFAGAMDMIKAIIDLFPEEFSKPPRAKAKGTTRKSVTKKKSSRKAN